MISNPNIYTDLQSLTQLRAQAQQNSPDALRAVAKQFEGLLMQMMLKSMRDASMGDGLMDSEQTDFYQGMFDQQLSLTLSQGRGLGLANMLIKQLGGDLADSTNKERQPVWQILHSLFRKRYGFQIHRWSRHRFLTIVNLSRCLHRPQSL